MSSTSPDPKQTPEVDGGGRRQLQMFWILPALTFLVGLLLGGVVVGVTGLGGDAGADDSAAEESPTEDPGGSAGPEPSGDATVTVPAECIETAELSQQAIALTREAAQAIGDLDARRLQEIVDDLQALEPEVNDLATRCRDAAEGTFGGSDEATSTTS